MFRLYKEELKKIFKIKINIILIILAMAYGIFNVYQVYHSDPSNGADNEFSSLDGRELNCLEYYQEADKILHQYKGTIDETLVKKYQEDYFKYYLNFDYYDYDIEKMKLAYGEDYLQLMEEINKGIISEQEFNEKIPHEVSLSYKTNGNGMVEDIGVFHKKSKEENFLNYVYIGMQLPSFISEKNIENRKTPLDDYGVSIPDSKNFSFEKGITNTIVNYEGEPTVELSNRDLAVGKLAAKHYQNQAYQFDSVVPNNLFVMALNSYDFVMLFVLVLILTPIFSMESRYEMTGIQVSSKKGKQELVIAKFMAGFTIAVGLFLLNLINIVIQSMIFLPVRDLNLLVSFQAGLFLEYMKVCFMTYKALISQCLFAAFTSLISTAFITMALSYFTKKQMVTFGIMTMVLLSSAFIDMMPSFLVPIAEKLPTALCRYESFFQIFLYDGHYRNTYFVLGDVIFSEVVLVSALWLMISFGGVFAFANRQGKRHIEA